MLRDPPHEPDYLDVRSDDVLSPSDLAAVAAWCLASARDPRLDVEWYRDLALAIAAHFEIDAPVVAALVARTGPDDLELALASSPDDGRASTLRQLWEVRERLLLLPGAWAGTEDFLGSALGDEALERQVDALAGMLLAQGDAVLAIVRAIDRAIVALWCGDVARAAGSVTLRQLHDEGLPSRRPGPAG